MCYNTCQFFVEWKKRFVEWKKHKLDHGWSLPIYKSSYRTDVYSFSEIDRFIDFFDKRNQPEESSEYSSSEKSSKRENSEKARIFFFFFIDYITYLSEVKSITSKKFFKSEFSLYKRY